MISVKKCKELDKIHKFEHDFNKSRYLGGFHVACKLKYESGMSFRLMAAQLKTKQWCVKHALFNLGLVDKMPKIKVFFKDDEKETIFKLYGEGISIPEISRRIGRQKDSVRRVIVKAGKLVPRKPGRVSSETKKKKDPNDGMSIKKCGCGQVIFSKKLKCNWCHYGGKNGKAA